MELTSGELAVKNAVARNCAELLAEIYKLKLDGKADSDILSQLTAELEAKSKAE